ncbi:MAG: TDP-N-acetylfucosamine:lipid II N-acetylfucosaminyltransferase [Lentisphaeria bacterium]|nr:TDP-N-acetylfucosamine:lipid II N-acetylfucosaminyltransferase [Lentisphaeria bacterium]
MQFVKHLNEHFDNKHHTFLIYDYIGNNDYSEIKNIQLLCSLHPIKRNLLLIQKMHEAKHIILHGLFIERVNQLLCFMPHILKKCYWIMWGGEFYFPDSHTFCRKKVIKQVAGLVTINPYEIDLVREWYGATGKHISSFTYPSNLFVDVEVSTAKFQKTKILIGNSATPTNRHLDIFNRIAHSNLANFELIVPLSYGDMEYAETIIKEGLKMFGEQFSPLREYLAYDDYVKLLSEIDIAVFDHNRQQGFGNIVKLVGLGKTVYTNSSSTPWRYLKDLGIEIFDVDEFSEKKITIAQQKNNIKIIKNQFSLIKLNEQLRLIFNDKV